MAITHTQDGVMTFIGGETSGALPGSTASGASRDWMLLAWNETTQEFVWWRQWGSEPGGSNVLRGMCSSAGAHAEAAVWVTGHANRAMPITNVPSQGAFDIVLARVGAADGSLQWAVLFGTPADEQAHAVALSNDEQHVLVAGRQDNPLFVLCFAAADGTLIWQQALQEGEGPMLGNGVVLSSGEAMVYVSGHGNGQPGAGPNLQLAKMDSAGGEFEWSFRWGPTEAHSRALLLSSDNARLYYISDTAAALPGQTSRGRVDFGLSCFHAQDGSVVWHRQDGTPEDDWHRGGAMSADAQYVFTAGHTAGALLAGSVAGGTDFAVLCWRASDGSLVWKRQWNVADNDHANALALGAGGGMLLIAGFVHGAGSLLGLQSGPRDVALVSLSCPAGERAVDTALTRCAPCPAGTFNPAQGALHCTPCAPGSMSGQRALACESVRELAWLQHRERPFKSPSLFSRRPQCLYCSAPSG